MIGKSIYLEPHSRSCRFSDSPQLATGFEPGVGLSYTTDLVKDGSESITVHY